jgi:hypothetical protein
VFLLLFMAVWKHKILFLSFIFRSHLLQARLPRFFFTLPTDLIWSDIRHAITIGSAPRVLRVPRLHTQCNLFLMPFRKREQNTETNNCCLLKRETRSWRWSGGRGSQQMEPPVHSYTNRLRRALFFSRLECLRFSSGFQQALKQIFNYTHKL